MNNTKQTTYVCNNTWLQQFVMWLEPLDCTYANEYELIRYEWYAYFNLDVWPIGYYS